MTKEPFIYRMKSIVNPDIDLILIETDTEQELAEKVVDETKDYLGYIMMPKQTTAEGRHLVQIKCWDRRTA